MAVSVQQFAARMMPYSLCLLIVCVWQLVLLTELFGTFYSVGFLLVKLAPVSAQEVQQQSEAEQEKCLFCSSSSILLGWLTTATFL